MSTVYYAYPEILSACALMVLVSLNPPLLRTCGQETRCLDNNGFTPLSTGNSES